MLRAKIQTALRVLYPPSCLNCATPVESDFGLCAACWRDTPFVGGLSCALCATPLPGQSDRGELCDECLSSPPPWRAGRAALLYQGAARGLVMALKHGDRQDIARPAAEWMARVGADLLHPGVMITPVPLHWVRLARRRYNQAALLAQALARRGPWSYCPDLLQRHRATRSTRGQGRAARLAQMQGAFRPHPSRRTDLAGRDLLLIDDVMTSGATLQGCCAAALAGGAASVSVLVLARAVKAPYISGDF